jgi:hypothetical protein
MEAGLSEFLLWQAKGIAAYELAEYDRLSYAFHLQTRSVHSVGIGASAST